MIGNIKLKPCPFCGGKAVIIAQPRKLSLDTMFEAVCESCSASTLRQYDRINAIKRWNARENSDNIHGHWQERQTVSGYTYECSVCKGHITYDEHGEEVFSDFCPYCSAILDEEVNEEDTGVKNEYLKLSPKKAESEE